jgi:hypothetical protein
VSRRDDERVADILDAADEIGAVIERVRFPSASATACHRFRRLTANSAFGGGWNADALGKVRHVIC